MPAAMHWMCFSGATRSSLAAMMDLALMVSLSLLRPATCHAHPHIRTEPKNLQLSSQIHHDVTQGASVRRLTILGYAHAPKASVTLSAGSGFGGSFTSKLAM